MTLFELEFGLTLIALAFAFAWPGFCNGLFAGVEKLFEPLARRKGLAAAMVGVCAIGLRLALLPLFPIPLPFVPDDFSFLLSADTFAHGRLANPTPAMWMHFETIHVSMLPTYQSMYFPGQGLILAAGQVLLGHPWFALLVLDGLMCAALTWMLQGWLPRNWALLGGFIAVLRLGLFGYWINTYHAAGTLAALGGVLLLGGLPRLTRTARMRYALLMGLGISILVLTRPYEGFLVCIPTGFVLIRWLMKGKNRPAPARAAKLIAAPLGLILATCAWLGYYDYRAFGSPLTLPYTVNRATYAMAPYYIWQGPRPVPVYRHAEMRDFYEEKEMKIYRDIHSVSGFLPNSLLKVVITFLSYSYFALLIPMLMIHRVFMDRRIRFLVVCVLLVAAGMAIEVFLLPHYVAPITCAFYAIGLQAMRHMRCWKPEGKPVGLTLVRLTVTVCVLMAGVRVLAVPLHFEPTEYPASNWNFNWFGPAHWGTERQQVMDRLEQLPGKQLVIVRYSTTHEALNEWVYNSADIAGSKVIWARNMNPAENRELVDYYKDRTVWLVEPDAVPVKVTPYAGP
ncbi:MAG: hypothetical protein WCC31_09750 [Terracidiphilus sp.]